VNVAMLGGAFDPPHLAHRALAQTAINELALDKLIIVPTGMAWHKVRELSDAKHRVAMAHLGFGEIDGVCIDERELRRNGPSFTVDTLRELAQEFPMARMHLILGEDQARAFTGWKDWEEILRLAIICVAAREVQDGPVQSPSAAYPELGQVRMLNMPAMDISSTRIRSLVNRGQGIDTLVFTPVARYIAHHHLYLDA